MKLIIVFAALFVVALAAPPRSSDVQIEESDTNVGLDSFKYKFKTSDGTRLQAVGKLKSIGPTDSALVVHGEYSYVGTDGVTYTLKYVADENGYHPEAEFLPKASQKK